MTDVESAKKHGEEALKTRIASIQKPFSYEETAYHLPISYALTGVAVHDRAAAEDVLKKTANNPIVASECLLAEQTAVQGKEPAPYTGFISDTVIRKLGYSLVDGSILGLALIVGTPKGEGSAAAICRELQEKYMLTFLAGNVVPSLSGAGVKVGLDYRLIPLGSSPFYGIHFVDIVARVAMMFGGVTPGDMHRLLAYAAERAKAIVIVFPGLTDEEIALVDGMRVLGFPILSLGGYENATWVPATPGDVVRQGMELKGIKVNVTAIPIPMSCSPAFEGKSIRKEEMYVEFGGGRSTAFELLRMREPSEIEDGKVTVIGPEIDAMKEGSANPLGIIIEVAGKAMKKDYEPVLERRIHNFVNYGEGSWHVAQRDLIWVRISKEAVAKGVKIEHIGKLLASKFRMDFPQLLDAVAVTLITDPAKVVEAKKEAERVYDERDARIKGMRDSDVNTYYSCTLCQTFAPNHVCVITPERLALCGAISWLDGKIAYEMSPSGANQPIEKGAVINELTGEFEGVNRFVKKASHGEIERCSLYSVMEYPMTCCGCFEAIALMLPEVNGIMVVNREYKGMTPSGMTFSTLAGTIGGGAQTPGFAGISKNYVLSDRFLQGEGGIERLVWMPAALKEELKERLEKKLAERGLTGFLDKVADETTAETIEALMEFLERVGHPALTMKPLV
ncbi:acetyl-CoA decarbonylase/synthase complex subunit alpha/beta [Methanoregula formicica]|uniref:CO-methylating acetyl-CoA synthase n=1 Tax=Methanoregula formicica (strain DSM 22288 / NBRC 105244 / SMSP) TaxID=593750 RepID=L0HCM2_METFS|nr:acetyl-CoA decarbonylase/synthase complex subunit alpha/beta [Methanoregula formicica]AGB02487.1 CO dehydrogenase/CO-methylating acetyl-CoA synthase complex, beta subunit [Methanoregula formicica SMSP]